jgi:hypothetical protein
MDRSGEDEWPILKRLLTTGPVNNNNNNKGVIFK